MKKVTSVTIWNDAVGLRMSMTFSEIDESTGRILQDNKRIDRIVTDSNAVSTASDLLSVAQEFVDRG